MGYDSIPGFRWFLGHGVIVMTRPLLLILALNGVVIPAAVSAAPDGEGRLGIGAGLVIKGGTVVEGTGAPRRKADVAVRGDRIVAVGTFDIDATAGAKVIDVAGWIVAPGFIDLHTHSDEGITRPRTRLNLN